MCAGRRNRAPAESVPERVLLNLFDFISPETVILRERHPVT
jgi:hypothetical protein